MKVESNKIAQNETLKQTLVNDDVKRKVVDKEKDKAKETTEVKPNPAAFTSQNAGKILEKAEAKAEAGRPVEMSETKNTLRGFINDVLAAAFRGNKGNDLDTSDTSTKKAVTDVKTQVQDNKKQEVPKLENPNTKNTGADMLESTKNDPIKDLNEGVQNLKNNIVQLQEAVKQQQQTQSQIV